MDISACDIACDCDTCQAIFEAEWDRIVQEKSLCPNCGIPKELSMTSLMEFRYMHFFQPCIACKPILEAFCLSTNICLRCQSPLKDGACPLQSCSDSAQSRMS